LTLQQVHPLDLDPSLVDQRTYTTRRRRHLLDAGSVLGVAAAFAILIPGHLLIPGLTGIGRPVTVFGALLAVGWFVAKLHPRLAMRGPQPMRWAAAMFLTTILLAYAAGYLRGLPTLEANAADRSLVEYLVYVGIALVCADGVANRTRLDELLKVLVALGAVMALIGHLQLLGLDLVDNIRIPGLVDQREAIDFRARGAFLQIASTAAHYIEFSTVMALLVPFGIHAVRFSRTRLGRQVAMGCTALIAAAIPVTLARTGFVGVAIGMLVLAWFWSWRTRFNFGILALGLAAALMMVRPGLLGTFQSLFAYASDDPSVQGRLEDYGPSFDYVAQRPWFGRGPGTFIPTLYRFVDNDWLIHLITVGVVGTIAYAGWHLTALSLAYIAYRRSDREEDRHLCACLIAVQLAAMAMAYLFDALAFTTHTTVLAILTGAAGAMWRFTHPSRRVRSAGLRLGSRHTDAPPNGRYAHHHP
jgi:O-antigen ligase